MSVKIKNVVVLMSTFNGAKYLSAQLESLETQEGVEITLLVNDDGSSDATMQILNNWRKRGLVSQIDVSDRVGSSIGFLQLLKKANDADFVAFCDQDDIWDPRKLVTLIQEMKHDEPCMVFSGRTLIDENGLQLPNKKKRSHINEPSFANALVENIAAGNCIVLNKEAVEIINLYNQPPVVHYDSWIYLIMTAAGRCICVPLDLVKYRIHAGNSVGLRNFGNSSKLNAVYQYALQASYLKNSSKVTLHPDAELILDRYLKLFQPSNVLFSTLRVIFYPIRRKSFFDALIYKLLLINLVVIQRRYVY